MSRKKNAAATSTEPERNASEWQPGSHLNLLKQLEIGREMCHCAIERDPDGCIREG